MHLHHLASVAVTHAVLGVEDPSSIAAHWQVTTTHISHPANIDRTESVLISNHLPWLVTLLLTSHTSDG